MSSRKVREMLRQRRVEFDKTVEENRKDNYLESLTKADLIKYAEANGIEVDKTARKAEILEKIKE